MKCINPYRKINPRYPDESPLEFIDCPCGKCFPCLVNKRSEWLLRLRTESLQHNYVSFVTLTYSDEFLPSELSREHLRNFFKRLRHHLSFKYYAIGEYGTENKRPHYHFIAFSDCPVNSGVSLSWSFGFVDVECPVSPAALNYVLHYHVRPKQPFGDSTPELANKRTFSVMSKGLGISLLLDKDGNFKPDIKRMLMESHERLISTPFGGTIHVPRYYIKKAEEKGLKVLPPMPMDYHKSNLIDYILKIEPDVVFGEDALPLNRSIDWYISLVNDLHDAYHRKLQKYNYQTKTSV